MVTRREVATVPLTTAMNAEKVKRLRQNTEPGSDAAPPAAVLARSIPGPRGGPEVRIFIVGSSTGGRPRPALPGDQCDQAGEDFGKRLLYLVIGQKCRLLSGEQRTQVSQESGIVELACVAQPRPLKSVSATSEGTDRNIGRSGSC